jgi:hypothetical protein
MLGSKEKEKESRHFECMLSLPIDGTKFLFPELLVTCANTPIIKWVYIFITLIMLLVITDGVCPL